MSTYLFVFKALKPYNKEYIRKMVRIMDKTLYLKKYIKRYRKAFLIALAFLILETLGGLVQPIIMANIIDIGVKAGSIDYIIKLGGIMLIITALTAVFASIRNIVSTKASQGFGTDLREDLYIKIQSLSLDNVDEFEEASLITRLTNDINHMQNFAHGTMRIFIKAPVMGIGAVILSFIINPKMGFIPLTIVPIVGIIIYFNLQTSYPIFKNMQKALDKVNGIMREYLAGIRVVKAFNRFDYEKERFQERNKDLRDITLKGMKNIAFFFPMVSFGINMGVVLILWFGGYRVNSGNMKAGEITALVNYMTQLLFALLMTTRVLAMLIRARASAERVGEVFITKNSMSIGDYSVSNKGFKGKLEFKNVYFKYREGKSILKNINFSIDRGMTLAIIGSTGSGKTTLINLIPRLYEPTGGSIKIDGVNIKDIKIEELRDRISLVPQKTLLFTGSIKDNIKWGNELATDEEVIKAAKISEAHDFIISFKEGYNTYLEQGGINLSGGQKQRIAIARALIKKPDILILDDSTSAVDMITEKNIREGIKSSMEDTTVILIAQRITSVMESDKILVMDKGEIVAMGKHKEIMDSSNVYRDIYYSQIGKGEDIWEIDMAP